MLKASPILAAFAVLALAGCGGGEKSHRGLDYMPDMYTSPSYKSQQVMEVVVDAEGKPVVLPVMTDPADVRPENGKIIHAPAMLMPPPGSVSRDFTPYAIDALDFASANGLKNPLAPTAEVLKEGYLGYRISCAPCHGNDGDATKGYVAHRFSGIPSLNTATIPFLTDGDLYHIITMGRNRMPNYRAQLLPDQRWAVVHYVRVLNRAWHATAEAETAFKAAAEAYAKAPTDADLKRAFENAKGTFAAAQRDLALIADGNATAESFVPRPEPKPEYTDSVWPRN